MRIFRIAGWLDVTIDSDKWNSIALEFDIDSEALQMVYPADF
jgi:hypothetical protein